MSLKIGIDLNHVLRDFNKGFTKQYIKAFSADYSLEEIETDNIDVLNDERFNFLNQKTKNEFLWVDYPFEIYGCSPLTKKGLLGAFLEWTKDSEFFEGEDIELIAISPMESDLAVESSLFFLSKGFRFRKTFFPRESEKIWDECDVVITANPLLFTNKPEDKKIVKIKRDFNNEKTGDLEYNDFSELMEDKDFFKKIHKIKN